MLSFLPLTDFSIFRHMHLLSEFILLAEAESKLVAQLVQQAYELYDANMMLNLQELYEKIGLMKLQLMQDAINQRLDSFNFKFEDTSVLYDLEATIEAFSESGEIYPGLKDDLHKAQIDAGIKPRLALVKTDEVD